MTYIDIIKIGFRDQIGKALEQRITNLDNEKLVAEIDQNLGFIW